MQEGIPEKEQKVSQDLRSEGFRRLKCPYSRHSESWTPWGMFSDSIGPVFRKLLWSRSEERKT